MRAAGCAVHSALPAGVGYTSLDLSVKFLRGLDADIIALQEVENRATGFDMLAYLKGETGFQAIAGPTLLRRGADYGNGLLTRFDALSVQRINLCVERCEPRGAIDVEVKPDDSPVTEADREANAVILGILQAAYDAYCN